MNNFDLKKYLAEGRLLKEDIKDKAISVLNNYKDKVKGVESYIKYLRSTRYNISSSIQAIADDLDRDNYTSDSLRRDLEKLSLAENKLLKEAKMGEPLNDRGLLNLIQQNMEDVLVAIDATPEDPTDVEIDFDGDGDPSIVIDGITGYSFRRPEDVDHVGPIGMETVDDGYSKPFEGQDGDEPRPIKIGGKDLMYIAYNI